MRTRSQTPISDLPKEYELLSPLHKGHHSIVLKCKLRSTGQMCVLKGTDSSLVSIRSLQALQELRHRNIITPRKVWIAGNQTWEELPLVEGTLLSRAVARGVGGLTGSVLYSCHKRLRAALEELHDAGLIYRDVHPDNVLLRLTPKSGTESQAEDPASRGSDAFGQLGASQPGGSGFFLEWILLDSTFALLAKDAQTVPPVVHEWATPEEQAIGRPTYASDMYAFGATLYFGITGKEPPSATEIRDDYLNGGHPSVHFGEYLKRLLATSPADRPSSAEQLESNTYAPDYTGTIRLSDDSFILVNTFDNLTRLVTAREALEFHRSMLHREYANKEKHQYWIALLDRYLLEDDRTHHSSPNA